MNRTRVISITSGKGGVGKTSIVTNLANELADKGKRVLILDGDFGMANVDIMFNVKSEHNIYDVLSGDCDIQESLTVVDDRISIIPGGSGIFELQNLNSMQKQVLLDQIGELSGKFDVMLVDTAPGIADHVLYLNAAANETIVVITPEPASMTDSYALIKVLNLRHRENRFSIVCNQVRDEKEGLHIFENLNNVVGKFLQVRLDYLASIPADLNLRQCTRSRQLITDLKPDSPSAIGISKLAGKLCGANSYGEAKGGLQFFWQQLVGAV